MVGYVDYDNVLDSIYIEKTSEYRYDDNDGMKECFEQTERVIFSVSFGNTGETLVLEDKEVLIIHMLVIHFGLQYRRKRHNIKTYLFIKVFR